MAKVFQLVKKGIGDRNVIMLERNAATKGLRIVTINRLTGTESVYPMEKQPEAKVLKIYDTVAVLYGIKPKKVA